MCANSEGSGEIARMRKLAWVFAGRLCGIIISWAGSHYRIIWKYVNNLLTEWQNSEESDQTAPSRASDLA